MALAKKCDRCGKLYESKDVSVLGYMINGLVLADRDKRNNGYYDRKYLDLCPACLVSLTNWLEAPKDEQPIEIDKDKKRFKILHRRRNAT